MKRYVWVVEHVTRKGRTPITCTSLSWAREVREAKAADNPDDTFVVVKYVPAEPIPGRQ